MTLSLWAKSLFFLGVFCLFADPALSALRSQNDPVPLVQTWNPKPAQDDILLPMPCELSMALRTVAIPGGLLRDKKFNMGVSDLHGDRQLYEQHFDGYIAAPFTARDLPEAWRNKLNVGKTGGYTFYFIGKYEVSRIQWEAVMQAVDDNGTENVSLCPSRRPSRDACLPQGMLSWFDTQNFIRKYNAWLVKNRVNALPHFVGTKNIGFIRLPTEEEWEFAARGGAKVPAENLENNDFFPLKGKDLQDYGVFSGQNILTGPAVIGSRHANPLGLYDTLGNLREIVDGFFHLSVADMHGNGEVYRRLHGASGGILCKGGSYSSTEDNIKPGWRDEIPLYTGEGESRPTDLGFRIVLAGLNIPNAQRLQTLKKENAIFTPVTEKKKTVKVNRSGDPLAELAKLAQSASTKEMQENLNQLHLMLLDQQSAGERRHADMLENSIRSMLYQEETLRAFAFRYVYLNNVLQKLYKNNPTLKKTADQNVLEATKELNNILETLITTSSYYKICLQRAVSTPQTELARIMNQFRQEYSGADVLNTHMRDNINTLEKHLKLMQNYGADALSPKRIIREIVPERHLKILPL